MNFQIEERPILFSEESAGGHTAGVVQLNRPKSLNALNTECYQRLEEKLKLWINQKNMPLLILEGAGDKAFCAGGDVKSLVLNATLANDFFVSEYFIDYWLRLYPKVSIALADGICMGGGLGLCQAATLRVVTEKTVAAMPEVAIGFFADVGATKFLTQMPHHFGLLMGLSGLRISGAEATILGLADVCVPKASMRKFRSDLLRLPLGPDVQENLKILKTYMQPFVAGFQQTGFQFEMLMEWQSYTTRLDFTNFKAFVSSFMDLPLKGERWDDVRNRMQTGSALSQQIFFEAYFRHGQLDWRQVFLNEWQLAMNFSTEPEFHEGVRSVLIDKDFSPKWRFSKTDTIMSEKYFESSRRNGLAEKLLNNGL